MTYMDPIFAAGKGLFGQANSSVCNGWTDAARFAKASGEAVQWAQMQASKPLSATRALCQIVSAVLITGKNNQWNYQVKLWTPPAASGGLTQPTDTWFSTDTCKNLREYYNDASTVDGMSLTTPAATIGPVGSHWNGTVWTTTLLEANVDVTIFRDTAGAAYYYFDRPNPMRCTE